MLDKNIITKNADLNLQGLMLDSGIGDNNEASYMAGLIIRYIRTCEANIPKNERDLEDPLPAILPQLVKKFNNKESDLTFAEKSILSIGFFRPYLERLTKFRSYPNYKVYGDAGKQIYFDYGKKDISDHFYNWTNFLEEITKPEVKIQDGIIPSGAYEKISPHKAYSDFRQWKAEGFIKRDYDLGDLKNDSKN